MSSQAAPVGSLSLEEWADLDEEIEGELVEGRLEEEEGRHFFTRPSSHGFCGDFVPGSPLGCRVFGSEVKLAVAPGRGRRPDSSTYLPRQPLPGRRLGPRGSRPPSWWRWSPISRETNGARWSRRRTSTRPSVCRTIGSSIPGCGPLNCSSSDPTGATRSHSRRPPAPTPRRNLRLRRAAAFLDRLVRGHPLPRGSLSHSLRSRGSRVICRRDAHRSDAGAPSRVSSLGLMGARRPGALRLGHLRRAPGRLER
jgi:hypothetical protein